MVIVIKVNGGRSIGLEKSFESRFSSYRFLFVMPMREFHDGRGFESNKKTVMRYQSRNEHINFMPREIYIDNTDISVASHLDV